MNKNLLIAASTALLLTTPFVAASLAKKESVIEVEGVASVRTILKYTEAERIGRTVGEIRVNEQKEKYEAAYQMKVISDGEKYVWASNKNKPLLRSERTIEHHKYGHDLKYTVFTNPNGEGMIYIRHDPSDTDTAGVVCDIDYGHNYIEYKLNEFGHLTEFIGSTSPYPWPKSNEYCD